jgi:hypothetical protein
MLGKMLKERHGRKLRRSFGKTEADIRRMSSKMSVPSGCGLEASLSAQIS